MWSRVSMDDRFDGKGTIFGELSNAVGHISEGKKTQGVE